MTKYILAAMAAVVIFSCSPKMNLAKNEITDASGYKMLLGVCSKKMLTENPYGEWFNKNLDSYTVDENTIALLKEKLAGKTFTIFMGTWCGDSKREVPRIYKVLQYAGVKEKQVKLVMVSNSDSAYKQSPTHEERGLNIHHVPTLIVYSNNAELGRIIESPVQSWEKDLLAICNGEKYTPHYAGAEYLEKQFSALGTEGVERDSTSIAAELKQLLKSEFELSGYAKTLRTSGRMPDAITTARLNALAFPEKADAWYILGLYHQLAGNKATAKQNYDKALAIKPGHENTKLKLAELEKKE
jgi:thiol-disulfide isomerase/thioredoxin